MAGLFGKLPAHGDFVRRGWSDETVDAIDRWLTDTIVAARAGRDDPAFERWMWEAPLWRGFVPAGKLGSLALHIGVAPSRDAAGRLFALAAGIAGEAGAVWHHAQHRGAALDSAIYDALAGAGADDTVEALGRTIGPPSGEPPSPVSAWWRDPSGPPAIESDRVDAALLHALLGLEPA